MQIFSFISIGQLLAPVIGGILYEKTGYVGVFGVAIGILALDFLMRLLIVEKKTAAKYMVPENDQSTIPANESDDREQNESDPLIRNPRHAAAENETDGDLELEIYKVRGEPGRVARAFPVTENSTATTVFKNIGDVPMTRELISVIGWNRKWIK